MISLVACEGQVKTRLCVMLVPVTVEASNVKICNFTVCNCIKRYIICKL